MPCLTGTSTKSVKTLLSTMRSFNKYLLSAYIVPGSVLKAEDTTVNKIDDSSYLPGAAILVGVDRI